MKTVTLDYTPVAVTANVQALDCALNGERKVLLALTPASFVPFKPKADGTAREGSWLNVSVSTKGAITPDGNQTYDHNPVYIALPDGGTLAIQGSFLYFPPNGKEVRIPTEAF